LAKKQGKKHVTRQEFYVIVLAYSPARKIEARGADGRSTMDSIKRQALETTDRESLQPGEGIDIYLDRYIVFYYIMLRLSLARIGESPVEII
jgi:hypothetical protein